ncbi:Protein FAM47E [Trichoplax sp. H2]|nr:Protein FAM47E [Trichoplax sp. H2]|eukprot:RDD36500.1 Protein FAM47E [Trichoplax sp. H2]
MAERKYDMLLFKNDPDKKKLQQTWYKERLRTKYITDIKKERSVVLNAKSWTFVKHGVDDFRTGMPSVESTECVTKGIKGVYSPNIYKSGEEEKPQPKKSYRKKLNKIDVAYSRKDFVDDYEYDLTQHPLALYPHLEECMPPDVFEDVVDVLDPELNIEAEAEDEYDDSDSNYLSPSESKIEIGDKNIETLQIPVITKEQSSNQNDAILDDRDRLEDNKTVKRQTYRWISKKEDVNVTEDDNNNRTTLIDLPEEGQEAKIKHVTRDFCGWVSSLGGESNNIEEATIFSLFASGYETKPALSVPIHVVELTNVPPELRSSANVANITNETRGALIRTPPKRTKSNSANKYFGAWYLPTKLWKSRRKGEVLEDPQRIKAKATSETKGKSRELDNELAVMHGAKAFREFIDKKSTRLPEFLESVVVHKEPYDRDNTLSKLGGEISRTVSAHPNEDKQ